MSVPAAALRPFLLWCRKRRLGDRPRGSRLDPGKHVDRVCQRDFRIRRHLQHVARPGPGASLIAIKPNSRVQRDILAILPSAFPRFPQAGQSPGAWCLLETAMTPLASDAPTDKPETEVRRAVPSSSCRGKTTRHKQQSRANLAVRAIRWSRDARVSENEPTSQPSIPRRHYAFTTSEFEQELSDCFGYLAQVQRGIRIQAARPRERLDKTIEGDRLTQRSEQRMR